MAAGRAETMVSISDFRSTYSEPLMLQIDNLHKKYGDVVALDGCSFTVTRGQLLGFLGPNGSGKTTTMRSVFSLLKTDSGQVLWDGHTLVPDRGIDLGPHTD